jgi:hypothetical protein
MKTSRVRKPAGCENADRHRVSRKWRNFIFRNIVMDLNVKLLQSPEGRNHLIIIAGGLIDTEGLERIFRQVAETVQRLFNCKVLIDLEKANLRPEPEAIDELVNELGPDLRHGNIKIALVSPAESDGSERLRVLNDSLISQDLTVAVFDNTKEAVAWLIDKM